MEISTIITIAVLAVIAIVFIIALVKSFAEAHWLHLVLVFFTFAPTIAGGVILSRSYKTRAAWQKQFRANEKIFEEQKAAYEVARNGSSTQHDFGPDFASRRDPRIDA